MFTESSNGSGFYPTYSYPCAGCSASIYSSNLEALSHNHVSMCTACLHGAAAFQYEPQAASLSTKCNNELNSANLLARHHEEVNPVSGFPYGPLSAYVVDPLVPTFNMENRVITQEANDKITKQCEDEIISWLLFNHNEEEQINNNGLTYENVDENVDIANYRVGTQIEYQQQYNQLQPYSFQQACNGTESVVPVQSTQAMEEHPVQLHSFYLGLEHEAFKAGFIQTPSSRWSTVSF